jgi:2-polyprenyl-3-methyl-5-hydroxy-6-metoxy-1,4-benzoquinol methylase
MLAEIEVHRTMICDRVRTDAFRQAIASVVRPGDILLDVGAGMGILSPRASRARLRGGTDDGRRAGTGAGSRERAAEPAA